VTAEGLHQLRTSRDDSLRSPLPPRGIPRASPAASDPPRSRSGGWDPQARRAARAPGARGGTDLGRFAAKRRILDS